MLLRLRRAVLYTAISLAVIYLADYLAARTDPPGSIQVQPYFAIHLKNKRIQFNFDVPAEDETCAQSLAPHLGLLPCWYLKRHPTRRIDE